MLGKLPRIVPTELRELLAFVPSHGWDAIEWRPLLKHLRLISWRITSRSGVRNLSDALAMFTDAVELGPPPGVAGRLRRQPPAVHRRAGDAVIRLYFAQWHNPDGMFIDLRPSRFALADDRLHFLPSGLWARISEDFRRGMIDLYLGFYGDDEALLDDALYRLGFLREDLSAAEADELRGLLRAHFGAETSAQHFSIAEFRESFNALFDFFVEHDYRLRSDFVIVGFYLITLYLTLEALGQRHNVRELCLAELDA
jgi:hypothetical protein